MRNIIAVNMVSVDGYFADKNGGIEWHVVEDEFNRYAKEFLQTVDTVLLGRITYELFEEYWPKVTDDPATIQDDLAIGRRLNEITKILCSKTPRDLTWQNTKQITHLDAAAVHALKEQPGKDIVIYGSGTIVQQLTNLGLIDEYHLFVAPVILGEGRSQFANVTDLHKLALTKTMPLSSGVVGLFYQAAGKE